MGESERHEMKLEATYPTGVEEWCCPVCGRRFLMQWQPYKKLVMQTGDEYADHNAVKGDLKAYASQVTQAEEGASTEEGLGIWQEWLTSVDFDSWWH